MISFQSVTLLAFFASSLTLTCLSQIKSTLYPKACHFHIRGIRRISHLLLLSTATALANSLVSSKFDNCNSLYSGISQANLNNHQSIQNSMARVITNTSNKISTHHTNTQKTTLASNQTKESKTNSVFSHKNTNKSTTFLYVYVYQSL